MKRALLMLRVLFAVLSIPSFLGWIFLTLFAAANGRLNVHSIIDSIGVFWIICGWLGWAAVFWLASNSSNLGKTPLPHWVWAGVILGTCTIAYLWYSSYIAMPDSVSDFMYLILSSLLFGGSPIIFAGLSVRHHLRVRRETGTSPPNISPELVFWALLGSILLFAILTAVNRPARIGMEAPVFHGQKKGPTEQGETATKP